MAPHSDPWKWLNDAQSRGVMPGLERMQRLLAALGNPERDLRSLHVAGTNGKGSVCAFAESILLAGGHHTGFYSSPHLVDFSERIRIDGKPACHEEMQAGIERLQVACRGWRDEELPTYFELVTALAFDLFHRASCDLVILETGLGGRLDATNTAPKIACAITPIALDHTEWLGTSLSAIAREKAGIFRAGVPAVIASQEAEAQEALLHAAREIGTPCTVCHGRLPMKNDGSDFMLGLPGTFQRDNAALALDLLKLAGFAISEKELCDGLASVTWPGRFQHYDRDGVDLVLDGAHNLHAIRQLVMTWHEEFGDRKCRLIFGALSDKDPLGMITILESLAEEVILVPVDSPRSFNPEHYMGKLRVAHRSCASLSEALDLVSAPLREGTTGFQTPVLLTGSLFLVGEALALCSGCGSIPRSQ